MVQEEALYKCRLLLFRKIPWRTDSLFCDANALNVERRTPLPPPPSTDLARVFLGCE